MKRVIISIDEYISICKSKLNTTRTLWTVRDKRDVTTIISKSTQFDMSGGSELARETQLVLKDLFLVIPIVFESRNRYSEYL